MAVEAPQSRCLGPESRPGALAVILFGPPGSGKGTQAKLLRTCLHGPHISTGDMLRQHIANQDAIGVEVQQLMKAGRLVPDDLVNGLVRERIGASDCRQGLMLDGYPRTINQADVLLKELSGRFRPAVVHLVVDRERLIERMSGRRQCPVCGTLYNLLTHPPRQPGLCDRDGTTLVIREDDRESVIRERLAQYARQTEPLLAYFSGAGVSQFAVEAGEASPEQIRDRICSLLESVAWNGLEYERNRIGAEQHSR